ncbi:universal stress protein [Calidifontibacter sp. DB0510]|uniref:Universal stress protein n=1 Tax=Metallococcus carri TaxID=1656884 RepID=A0A967B0Y5_9MICO|nr:universal stress protein [Metallococcus carri]NHN56047.1 universal stress protein [Metallococcus carri]NOP37496.1 universal stress protein [Calidifontibacter sp. DB2511S]
MSIVVGYAGNAEGDAALERGAIEASAHGIGLTVVPFTAEAREGADRFAAQHPGTDVVSLPDDGDVVDGLFARADEAGAELIVIGLRKRTAVGKLILGGSAQRILLDARCPVLTVTAE